MDASFGHRLRHMEVGPPAHVWAGVEGGLRRRRRRAFVWWFATTLLSAAGMAAVLWFVGGDPGSPPVFRDRVQVFRNTQPSDSASWHAVASDKGALVLSDGASDRYPAAPEATADINQHHSAPVMPKKAPRARLQGASDQLVAAVPVAVVYDVQDVLAVGHGVLDQLPVQEVPLAVAGVPIRAVPERIRHRPIRPGRNTHPCYPFKELSRVWMLDAWGGPTLANKRLEVGQPAGGLLIEARRNSEMQDWGFNAGVRASVLSRGRFVARSGLSYEQFAERFVQSSPNAVELIIRQRTEWSDNKWVTVTDTLGLRYGDAYTQTYNRFGLLDIPLEAGMEWRGKRAGLSVHMGLSVNLLFWKSGRMFADPDQSADIADIAPRPFRSRVGWSGLVGIQGFYHLNTRTRIFAEPYFRHIFRPVSDPQYPIVQRYNLMGLRIGMTRAFL
jgi:hypothetical protein